MKKVVKAGLIVGGGAVGFVCLCNMICGFFGMGGMHYRYGYEQGTKEFLALMMDGLKPFK